MVERMDRLAGQIGETITGQVQGDGVAVCTRCNSRVPFRNLMLRDWRWHRGPTCPNCGTLLDLAAQSTVESDATPVPQALGQERFCPHCGSAYQHLVTDVRSGEIRPSRFCPHCGRSLLKDQSETAA